MSEIETVQPKVRHLLPGSVIVINGKQIEIESVHLSDGSVDSFNTYTVIIDGQRKENSLREFLRIERAAEKNEVEIISGGWNDRKEIRVTGVEVEGELEQVIFASDEDRRFDESYWQKVLPLVDQQKKQYYADADLIAESEGEDEAERFLQEKMDMLRKKYYPEYVRGYGSAMLTEDASMKGKYNYTIIYPSAV